MAGPDSAPGGPAWAWLVLGEAARRPGWDAAAALQEALRHGRQRARELRGRFGGASPWEMATALGMAVVRSSEDPQVGWRQRRSEYDPRRRRATLYTGAVERLQEAAARFGLEEAFPRPVLEALPVAHELYHHLEATAGGPLSARHRRTWLRLGPLRLTLREPALDEVAAHGFVQELCGLRLSPAVLDLASLSPTPEAGAQAGPAGPSAT